MEIKDLKSQEQLRGQARRHNRQLTVVTGAQTPAMNFRIVQGFADGFHDLSKRSDFSGLLPRRLLPDLTQR